MKCPKCGASEITLNEKTGELRCEFCRFIFKADSFEGNLNFDAIQNLNEIIYESNSKNVKFEDLENSDETITSVKCKGCGSVVNIDFEKNPYAKCHWCRTILSPNEKVENGLVPDIILPFKTNKETAKQNIEKFLSKRKFFANKTFKNELNLENVYGVYLPYIVADVNEHVNLSGLAQRTIGRNKVKISGRNEEKTIYKVEESKIEREFDLLIDDLLIESNTENLDLRNKTKSTNILNSLLPFDTENAVEFNPHYLIGYNSEKRNSNVNEIKEHIENQIKDINKFSVADSIRKYDRGVQYTREDYEIKGMKYISAYLPFWIYGYKDPKTNFLHYIAVNGRTQKTNGNVPVEKGMINVAGILMVLACLFIGYNISDDISVLLFFLGLGMFAWFQLYNYYANISKRFKYETITKTLKSNLKCKDMVLRRFETEKAFFAEANNNTLAGNRNSLFFPVSNNTSNKAPKK